MIQLTGLNGATIIVAPNTVYRIRATTPLEGKDVMKVEYAGGYIFTLESISSLLARMPNDLKIIKLTTRSATSVYLNGGAVTRARDALPMNGPGTEITVSGQYQHVVETLQQVETLLSA